MTQLTEPRECKGTFRAEEASVALVIHDLGRKTLSFDPRIDHAEQRCPWPFVLLFRFSLDGKTMSVKMTT